MRFEFDENKSRTNKEKHGIDFVEAQQLWHGPIVIVGGRDVNEKRMLVIGEIDGKPWTAIITMRDGVIRIISVRRARDAEEKFR